MIKYDDVRLLRIVRFRNLDVERQVEEVDYRPEKLHGELGSRKRVVEESKDAKSKASHHQVEVQEPQLDKVGEDFGDSASYHGQEHQKAQVV